MQDVAAINRNRARMRDGLARKPSMAASTARLRTPQRTRDKDGGERYFS